ncbi:SIS domain-containing protein [Alteribacillus bidgolensis]|uniref:RpiR family transcriptional regulator, glv operon transcriptional regulator n=1 Tax=Alteribacillus bidgolensis TaxID=930129 RepID=A0A1G8HB34_9BACI|nr:SIS domain-containing protein [Alteribacillus bidgolensis]SDI03779.1 RpiR family transcriptional regulator, glv operon transcriptional regulator [Alteribacillus bidgolensis]
MLRQRVFRRRLVVPFITVIHDQTEFEVMLPGIQENDVIIILSYSGETPALIPQIKQLTARGIDFISITNLKNNKLAQMSPHNIYATSSTTITRDGTEVNSFIPFHIAIDLLFRKYVEFIEKEERSN